jgi:hypothetical protein
MATYTDIVIDQGSSFSSVINVNDKNGFSFDLTGYNARGQIKRSYTSSSSINIGCVINDPLSGSVAISLESSQTRAMKAGRYLFDVEIYNSSGNVIRISEGQVEVFPAVTNTQQQTISSTTAPTDLSVIWYDPTDDSYSYYDPAAVAWIEYN